MKRVVAVLVLALTFGVASACEVTRSRAQVNAFKKVNPCPQTAPHKKGTCPGFVVDHVKALACGGADRPENMQWQTTADGKAKDKWELKECGK